MFLHLGKDTMVKTREIVGIFDLDTASLSKKTREFLTLAQKGGRVVSTTNELPKSFIVMANPNATVYISQLASSTLKGRAAQAVGIK